MINKYDLHDSLIENIKYLQHEKKLMIEIELCNWKQSSYHDGEPEMLKMLIGFTGVKKYWIDPETMAFQSDEILETILIKGDTEGSEAIKIVLNGEKDIKIIEIFADEVKVENE